MDYTVHVVSKNQTQLNNFHFHFSLPLSHQGSPNQLYIYIYPPFFKLLFHIGHYRVLSRVLCAPQQIFISCLFYVQQSMYGAFLVAQWYRIHLQCRRPGLDPWVRKTPWSRAWQPTTVFLPEESHGWRRLAGYNPLGHKQSDTTVTTQHTHMQGIYVNPNFPIYPPLPNLPPPTQGNHSYICDSISVL